MARGRAVSYSRTELAWIKASAQLPRREAYAAFIARFGRDDVSYSAFAGLCKRKRWLTGRSGRFAKGNVPWCLGQKRAFSENSARTQFKKGQAPHNTKTVGHERTDRYGYTHICVAETNPHTGFRHRYVLKHKHLWEKLNGPVPAGHCLKCLDGDKSNTDPSNWRLIPRSMVPRLAGRWTVPYDSAPAELKPLIMRTAELAAAVKLKAKKGQPA